MPSLNSMFAESGGAPVKLQGEEVRPLYRRRVAAGEEILIAFDEVASPRPQALVLAVSDGEINVEGSSSSQVILWEDAAPTHVAARCSTSGSLDVWNAWRHEDGVTDEWTNNAGMVVEPRGREAVRLRMSDGVGEPSFDDLVVTLTFATTPN